MSTLVVIHQSKPKHVSATSYLDYLINHIGWCTKCKAFTTGNIDPELLGASCKACHSVQTVWGARIALENGWISLTGGVR